MARRCLAALTALLLGLGACAHGEPGETAVPTTAPPSTPPMPEPSSAPPPTSAPPTTQPSTPSTPSTPPASTAASTPPSSPTPSSPPTGGPAVVNVYFATAEGSDCSDVTPFPREVSAPDPLVGALAALLGGPTASEAAAGAESFFSDATAEGLRAAELTDGLLVVDLRDDRHELRNATTSCGSASLLAQLNATVFQFVEVERVRYTFDGSCGAFFAWLQRDCQDQTRTGSVPVDLDTHARASGSGCTPGTARLPDGEWYGIVTRAGPRNVAFDLACWFSGVAASDAAAEDGQESPVPNDYHVRNESDRIRVVPVDEAATVTRLVRIGGIETRTVTYGRWVASRSRRGFLPGAWLTVEGGEVVEVVEQYTP